VGASEAGEYLMARSTRRQWIRYLISILLGNALYFTLMPHLPPAARHEPFRLDVGILVDFWFCLFVYGLLQLASAGYRHGRD